MPLRLLIDSGASGPILHEDFVCQHGLLVKKRKHPKEVKSANEGLIPNAGTHYTQPTVLVIGQRQENMGGDPTPEHSPSFIPAFKCHHVLVHACDYPYVNPRDITPLLPCSRPRELIN